MKKIYKGKTAMITGATSGIGLSMAKELALMGCDLIITYRNEDKLKLIEPLFADINFLAIKCDFENNNQVSDMVSILKNKNVDILVNSAGVFPIKNLRDSSVKDFDSCFNVNVKIPFILSSLLGKKMCKNEWGRIINIGSSSSYNGSSDTGIYCASKHALLGLSRSLYKEFKDYNVRVYSVSPGSCQTPMGLTDKRQDFKTFITPDEVAKIACYNISFDGEGISEEIRINRMVIR